MENVMEKEKKQPRKSAAKQAADIIKKFEGFESGPYLCPANVATIGYGTTIYADGTKVSMDDDAIDEDRATEELLHHIKAVEKQVNAVLDVKLKAHQKAALISFVYNVGIGNFTKSTLLRKVNHCSDDQHIPDEFRRWTKGGGRVLRGLIRRRESEVELWTGSC
jgi:lysozyme